MTHANLLALANFTVALPGAAMNTVDTFQRFKKRAAKRKKVAIPKTFRDLHPFWYLSLTTLAVVSVLGGFWTLLHHSEIRSIPKVAKPTATAPVQTPLIPKPLTPYERLNEPNTAEARREFNAEVQRLEALYRSEYPSSSFPAMAAFVNRETKAEGYPYELHVYAKSSAQPAAPVRSNPPPCIPGTGMNITGVTVNVGPGVPAGVHSEAVHIRGEHPCLQVSNVYANRGTGVDIEPASTPVSQTTGDKPK